MPEFIIIAISISVCAAVIVAFVAKKMMTDHQIQNADKIAKDRIDSSKKEADQLIQKAQRESKDYLEQGRRTLDNEIKSRNSHVEQIENRMMQKEKHLDDRESHLVEKDTQLNHEIEKVKAIKVKQETIVQDLMNTLEKAAGFSQEEAQNILMKNVERNMRHQAGLMIKQMEDQARKIANRKAKEIITDAIQRTAVDHVVAATTSIVQIPDDEMKGRIIGREGRNIRAFESITGVDVIIDDTPGAVVLSSFDPIRREIARMALEKLIGDGRIHPSRVEEMVDRARKELEDVIRERGEQAADQLGLKFHPKIIELLGKLHYRTSYGQNILAHAIEAAHIAGIMAYELRVNAQLAKRGAVLHDIGKALDFEQEGSHDDLGAEVCKKYGESDEVINCIMAHHEDQEPDTIEAILVGVADALSSARPGARRESIETYVKRLEKLEALANSFEGIEKAFAIQAGREIRVMVQPEKVDDPGAYKLALDMAQRIESELEYPGEIKVSIIRETRATAIAR